MKKYTMDQFIKENISVKVNEDNIKQFLQMCEEKGLIWASGRNPLAFTPYYAKSIECGVGHRTARLSFSDDKVGFADWEVVDFSQIIPDKQQPRYQIIIDCDGDTTTAKMIINGKEVKAAKAKRNPADKFNWKLAADLAFNRLWGEKKPDYREVKRFAKVGEYIKLIEKEFSFNKKGDILHVSEIAPSGNPVVKESGHPRKPLTTNANGWCYSKDCFVVLEGYKPSK